MKSHSILLVCSALVGFAAIAASQGGLGRANSQGATRFTSAPRQAELREVGTRMMRLDSKSGKAEILQIKGNLEGAQYVWVSVPVNKVTPQTGNYQFLLKQKGVA